MTQKTIYLIEACPVLAAALDALLAQSLAQSLAPSLNVSSRHIERLEDLSLDKGMPLADIILLGRCEAGFSGREACEKLRQTGLEAPIIWMMEEMCETDPQALAEEKRIVSLAKPFHYNQLWALLHPFLQSAHKGDLKLGAYRLAYKTKQLYAPSGAGIMLTEKEIKLIECLAKAGGSVMSRAALLEEVWGFKADITTHTLETHIYRLRQKLAHLGGASQALSTQEGGYALCFENIAISS